MNSVHAWLHDLMTIWQKEPMSEHQTGLLYLTPEQRYRLLKELLMPVSESKKPGQ